MASRREVLRDVLSGYFQNDLFLKDDSETRTLEQLVDDLDEELGDEWPNG